MLLRRGFMPKKLSDTIVIIYVIIMIPLTYYFEVFVVFPYFMNQFWYFLHSAAALFVLYNVVTNYVAMLMCDTSLTKKITTKPDDDWRYCEICKSYAPPRSWHCDTCKVCILKKDHHCVFSGTCIGHNNMRYFYMFTLYVFIATFYSFFFNIAFLYRNNPPSDFERLLIPLKRLMYKMDLEHFYIIFTLLLSGNMIFAGSLLLFHGRQIKNGQITVEARKGIRDYDMGSNENVKQVFGENWKFAWLSPFYESKATSDGYQFGRSKPAVGKQD